MSHNAPTLAMLERWLNEIEDEHLEFKEAKTQFDSTKLTRYCVALANEGDGYLIFGVSDKKPRVVVGTAINSLDRLKRVQSERTGLRIGVNELVHSDGRVVIVTIPSRPIGHPIEYQGSYWIRRGEDLVPMRAEVLKVIFDEAQPDYSAEICAAATMDDIDSAAVEKLRTM